MIFSKRSPSRKRYREKPKTFHHVLYGVLSILVVVLLAVAVWYLTRLPAVTITTLTIEGGETIPHETIRSIVERELTGDYALLIPYRFSYLYPHEQIVTLLSAIPRIHSVSLRRTGRTELTITFAEYEPYALWCQGEDSTAPCYFISRTGYAFAPAPPLRGNTFTRHVFEEVTELDQRSILTPGEMEKIDLFKRILEDELGLRSEFVTHTTAGDIRYRINGGGSVLVANDMDVEVTYKNLKSILDSEEFDHLAPGNFNYIDLRFGNKIFVNEEFDTGTTTEAAAVTEEVEEVE